jgi:hypothetical protein
MLAGVIARYKLPKAVVFRPRHRAQSRQARPTIDGPASRRSANAPDLPLPASRLLL